MKADEILPVRYSLNGDWDFAYEYAHDGEALDPIYFARPPVKLGTTPVVPESELFEARMPVPGRWDDHLDRLRVTGLWNITRFNPEARPVAFPTNLNPPDMAYPYLKGLGWYRRSFDAPADWSGQCITLHVGGVMMEAWVYCNGEYVGHHLGHSTPFEMPLEKYLRPGRRNDLVIGVCNARGDRNGIALRGPHDRNGGITRPVCLKVSGEVRIRSLYLRSHGKGTIAWRLELGGRDGRDVRDTDIEWFIREHESGRTVAEGTADGTGAVAEWSTGSSGLREWSDRDPALYRVGVCVQAGGRMQDAREQDFGLRTVSTEGYRILLNGKPVYLRGHCESHYFPLTCVPPTTVEEYRERICNMQRLGYNWIRFHTWVPSEEFLQAADELGMLMMPEGPTWFEEPDWRDILMTCRSHPSVIIYSGGNEECLTEDRIEFFGRMAAVQKEIAPDALFLPMEAMRGVEYGEGDQMGEDAVWEPVPLNRRRLERVKQFSDCFGQYAWGHLSYEHATGDPEFVNENLAPYERPCLTHEAALIANFLDLDLEHRYEGTRIGPCLYKALREHLKEKGLLSKASAYFQSSARWASAMRKNAIEKIRRVDRVTGYDHIGATDFHWHRTGYESGILNEFMDLKPGESESEIRRYNNESVLLLKQSNERNYASGDNLDLPVAVSHFGSAFVAQAVLTWALRDDSGQCYASGTAEYGKIGTGAITGLGRIRCVAPDVRQGKRLTIACRLTGGGVDLDNEWRVWVFPKALPEVAATADPAVLKQFGTCFPGFHAAGKEDALRVVAEISNGDVGFLERGGSLLLLGHKPFPAIELRFHGMTAGRAHGHRGLLFAKHPVLVGFPHDDFADWQCFGFLQEGNSIEFEEEGLPFDPIIEVIGAYKRIRRQAGLFEARVGKGKLMACPLRLSPDDPAARFLVGRMLAHMTGTGFAPRTEIAVAKLRELIARGDAAETLAVTDQAGDPNVLERIEGSTR